MDETPQIVLDLAERLETDQIFPVLEGGWFLPTWRADRGSFQPPSDDVPSNEPGIDPNIASSLPGSTGYYVLTKGELGALHVLQCVEIYTFVEGDPVDVCWIDPGGNAGVERLDHGRRKHFVVEGRMAHAVQSLPGTDGYSLLHLVTVPGFVPEDASIPSRDELLARFPQHRNLIERFTHDEIPVPPAPRDAVPYMQACHNTVKAVPILTVGDDIGGVRFAGAPDGIGAYRDCDNENWMRVLITHELFFHQGRTRAHGAPGAFVSEWVFDLTDWDSTRTMKPLSGEDLICEQHYWSFARQDYKTSKSLPFERLCSADLPPQSALFFNSDEGPLGTQVKLFMGGEETHTQYRPDHGRALAHIVSGRDRGHTYELPSLGRCSYENIPLNPLAQKKTIAVCLDDATNFTSGGYLKRAPGSELYVYVGEKTKNEKDPIEAAGLVGGTLYGVKVARFCRGAWKTVESEKRQDVFGKSAGNMGYRFTLEPLSDRRVDDFYDEPGVAQQKESLRLGVTRFLRIEDGSWDPRSGKEHWFYFVTTDEYDGMSRLFKLSFEDITRPEIGGTLEVLLSGCENGKRRFQMLDSLTVDPWGRVLLQEDTGEKKALSRTLVFEPDTGDLRVALQASPDLFGSVPSQLTTDEESSGIIPVFDLLGEGWYLTNLQAHSRGKFPDELLAGLDDIQIKRLKRELVEAGQLLAVHIPKDIQALPET